VNRRRRRTGAAGVALVAVAGIVAAIGGILGHVGVAHAATAYRYWAYYVADDGGWIYSQRGPAAEHPVDGEVQGWRFAIQVDAAGAIEPRLAPDFGRLCASTPAQPGQLRVGVVLDFGLASDAPSGERPPSTAAVTGCVRVPAGASGADVLVAAVGSDGVRASAGMVCGIDNYPKTECAPSVRVPTTQPATTQPATTQPATARPTSPATMPPATTTKPPAAATPASAIPPTTALTTARAAASQPQQAPPPGTRAPTSTTAPTTPSAPTTLADLRTPSRHAFPWGAVIGGALVVVLGVAAAWRGLAGRR